ncbi:MAG: hypothetical protein KF746_07355 [Chitinophagaceae bacterium]|nr:hypothetical protein [Chitinophagaceae bacterium]
MNRNYFKKVLANIHQAHLIHYLIKKVMLLLMCLVFGSPGIFCQDSLITGETESQIRAGIGMQTFVSSNNAAPFWLRTNKYGSIPVEGVSASLLAAVKKDYNANKDLLMDWGFSLEARANIGKRSNFLLIEGFAKARMSIFQLKAGRAKDVSGLVDSTLSSGAFALSGNALGIPKIELSIPTYWNIPFTGNILAIKGSFSHGWFGKTKLNYTEHATEVSSYYHQKTFYGRIGKPEWRWKLYAGFNHQVMWGNEKQINGSEAFPLSDFETYWYVISGKAYGTPGILATSKVGNHIGSIDQAFEYNFDDLGIHFYHQFFYEVGGLYYGNNVKDGLWGIAFKNKRVDKTKLGWKKVLFEYWGSKSQGGELDAPITPSGDEDYYNNYTYYNGWTYGGENMGNNFLTNKKYALQHLPSRPKEYIVNNRVILFHTGIEGHVGEWNCTGKFSFSRNFGTYGSSSIGGSMGEERFPGPPPYFEEVRQLSIFLNANKTFGNNYCIGFSFALDSGKLLPNSAGAQITLSKAW